MDLTNEFMLLTDELVDVRRALKLYVCASELAEVSETSGVSVVSVVSSGSSVVSEALAEALGVSDDFFWSAAKSEMLGVFAQRRLKRTSFRDRITPHPQNPWT